MRVGLVKMKPSFIKVGVILGIIGLVLFGYAEGMGGGLEVLRHK